jgi:hypothetical protein
MIATKTHEPPTRKQLAYLRSLARTTGTTFTLPRTKRQASYQISQLSQRPASAQVELALDIAAVRGGDIPETA